MLELSPARKAGGWICIAEADCMLTDEFKYGKAGRLPCPSVAAPNSWRTSLCQPLAALSSTRSCSSCSESHQSQCPEGDPATSPEPAASNPLLSQGSWQHGVQITAPRACTSAGLQLGITHCQFYSRIWFLSHPKLPCRQVGVKGFIC